MLLLKEIEFLSKGFPFLAMSKSGKISLVYCLKCPYSCFSFHFCFLVIVVLLILMLSVGCCFGWLFGFYVVSTFVGYLTPNSVYM